MKIRKYLKLRKSLQQRMAAINETMALTEMAETYSEYVCKMHNWQVRQGSGFSLISCELVFSFINGYRKAIADNGFEFKNGLVQKRSILEDMPCGALNCYKEDMVKETKEKAEKKLRLILKNFNFSKANINQIANAFKKEIEKEE